MTSIASQLSQSDCTDSWTQDSPPVTTRIFSDVIQTTVDSHSSYGWTYPTVVTKLTLDSLCAVALPVLVRLDVGLALDDDG